jgi:DNA-binding transcriptional ArsR family regulator
MPRAATTTDVFNAIAEPRRRQIIDFMARRGPAAGMAVGAIVAVLGLAQPAVSKHLAVLREVGIVTFAKQGQQRLYQLQPKELKSVYDWISKFERHWSHQLDRIKQRAEHMASDKVRQSTQLDRKKGPPS